MDWGTIFNKKTLLLLLIVVVFYFLFTKLPDETIIGLGIVLIIIIGMWFKHQADKEEQQ